MTEKLMTDLEIIEHLDSALAEDLLNEAYSSEEICSLIHQNGGDPDAIGQRGAALVQELLKQRRLFWQPAAKQRAEQMKSVFDQVRDLTIQTRDEVLNQLELLRTDSLLGEPIRAAFRKRKPEEAADDELRALLKEMEALRTMNSIKTDKSGDSE